MEMEKLVGKPNFFVNPIKLLFINSHIRMYYAVLPQGCNNIDGPHSLACLSSIWSEGGCTDEGRKNPSILTQDEVNVLRDLSIQ